MAARRRRRALIVFGLYRWFTRKRSAHTPRWMQSLSKLTPLRAAGTAVVLTVVNPKVLFICAAAGLAIGTAGLGSTGVWIAEVWYVVVAASTVAIPILAYAVSGDRLDEPLPRLKDWMERQHATLVAGDPGRHRSSGAVQGNSRSIASGRPSSSASAVRYRVTVGAISRTTSSRESVASGGTSIT